VMYLEPHTPQNLRAIGFDLYSEPVRREAMQRALDTGEPSLSGPVQLLLEPGQDSRGLVLFVPVFREGRPLTPAARRDVMLGWVFVPISVDVMVEHALAGHSGATDFVIHDITGAEPVPVYESADWAGEPAFTHSTLLEVAGRTRRIDFRSPPMAAAMPPLLHRRRSFALGLFASLLLYLVAWPLARPRSRAHALGMLMTGDPRRSDRRCRAAVQYSAVRKVLRVSQGDLVEANPVFARL